MTKFLILIVGAAVGFAVARIATPATKVGARNDKTRKVKKRGAIKSKIKIKKANEQKLLALLKNKSKIRNDEVEKFLGVSDATAERYLDELEAKGVIRQVGRTGRNVYYQKT